MRRSAALIPALALAVLLTACSSSSNGTGTALSAGASGTSTSKGAATSSSANAKALDETQLKALLLTKDDVPAGWVPSASSTDTSADDTKSQAEVAACVGVPDPDLHKVAEANSDDYDLDNSEISSSATSYGTQAELDAAAALITNPKAEGCYQKLFSQEIGKDLPAGATVDKVVVQLTPGSNGGPDNVIAKAEADITVTAQGQTVELFIDSFFIKGRQIGGEVDFFGFGQKIDESIQSKALTAVADRVAAA